MEGGKMLRNSQIIILGICIAVATIVSSVILSGGFLKVMKFTREQITVTGSATKEIKSDYIVWKGELFQRIVGVQCVAPWQKRGSRCGNGGGLCCCGCFGSACGGYRSLAS